jgi:Sugar (and other) transporter
MQCNPLFILLMALVVPGHQDYGLHKPIRLHSEHIRKIANWVVQWSLLVGSAGQAFAMLYIGINSAVNPTKAGEPLTGTSTFSIVCVYLFVVFYSFGWGPVPFVLSSECSPNHGELRHPEDYLANLVFNK